MKAALFVLFLFGCGVEGTYQEQRDKIPATDQLDYDRCFGTERFPDYYLIDNLLKDLICEFVIKYDKHFVFHSGFRKRGQHPLGKAIDAHYFDYRGLNELGKLLFFRIDLRDMREFLKDKGYFYLVGLGIYPNQKNPFIHLDTRMRFARWARLVPQGTDYVTISLGEEWLEDRIEELRNE